MDREKMPSAKQVLGSREYQEYERKKDVMCEIIPIDIKSANNDSLKCLVFKIGKADPNARKNTETNAMNATELTAQGILGIENIDYYSRGAD
jgi:hypothetical protein